MWRICFKLFCLFFLEGVKASQKFLDSRNILIPRINSSHLPQFLPAGPPGIVDAANPLASLIKNYTEEWSYEFRNYIGGEFFSKKTQKYMVADCEHGALLQYHILPSKFFKPPFYIVVKTVGSEYKIVVTWTTMALYECFQNECMFLSTATSSEEPYILKLHRWSYVTIVPETFHLSVGIGHSKIKSSLVITLQDESRDFISSEIYISVLEKGFDKEIKDVISKSYLSKRQVPNLDFGFMASTSKFSQTNATSIFDYTKMPTMLLHIILTTAISYQLISTESTTSPSLEEHGQRNKEIDQNLELGSIKNTPRRSNDGVKKRDIGTVPSTDSYLNTDEAGNLLKRHHLVEDLLIIARCHRKTLKSKEMDIRSSPKQLII